MNPHRIEQSYRVESQHYAGVVKITIDLESIARTYGARALENKTARSVALSGAIDARVITRGRKE